MLDKCCTFALVIKKQHLYVQTGSIRRRLTGLEGDKSDVDEVHLQNHVCINDWIRRKISVEAALLQSEKATCA